MDLLLVKVGGKVQGADGRVAGWQSDHTIQVAHARARTCDPLCNHSDTWGTWSFFWARELITPFIGFPQSTA